jgi:hypothetical protein
MDQWTDKELQAAKRTQYTQLRGTLRDGDLLLCSGAGGFLGRTIKHATGSPWTHVGMTFWFHHRLLLLHAAAKGVQFYPLSRYVAEYEGTLAVCRHNAVTAVHAAVMARAGGDWLGTEYDKIELVRIGLRQLASYSWIARAYVAIRGIAESKVNDVFICSELVEALLRKAGIKIARSSQGVFPSHIWNDPDVTLVSVIE